MWFPSRKIKSLIKQNISHDVKLKRHGFFAERKIHMDLALSEYHIIILKHSQDQYTVLTHHLI
ncbi:MAG: Hypothetical protein AJITA_00216 [Acetilactobacillus jinshanensis]